MKFIDTHTHIYVEEFNQDIETVILTAEKEGVKKFFLPAIDSSCHKKMFEAESHNVNKCFCMMGLHPCSVNESYNVELNIIKELLQQRKFAAIGEIGLDYYWDKTHVTEQQTAFEQQMQWALDYNLPINIHTRNATQETIEMVKPFAKNGLSGIFHCFGGSYETAKQIIDMNFLLGIGGVVTYPKAGLQDVLPKINMEHIVLETDAPYLTPVPFRGKRNQPCYIKIIAQKIADIKRITIEDVANTTTLNAENLYNV